MIDLHCHILPEMDDGATSYDEAVEMAKSAKKNKIGAVIATPHFVDYDEIDEFIMERNEKIVLLNKILGSLGVGISIGCGAEVYLKSDVFTAGDLNGLTVNGSRYMLCEYSLKPFDIEKAVIYAEEICNRGYVPIIAHPERYISFWKNPEVVNELWDLGCRFQVNVACLAGRGGEQMQEFASNLILRGFVDFLGTDAHSVRGRDNRVLSKIDDFPKEIDERRIEYLTQIAPEKVVRNEELEKRDVGYF